MISNSKNAQFFGLNFMFDKEEFSIAIKFVPISDVAFTLIPVFVVDPIW